MVTAQSRRAPALRSPPLPWGRVTAAHRREHHRGHRRGRELAAEAFSAVGRTGVRGCLGEEGVCSSAGTTRVFRPKGARCTCQEGLSEMGPRALSWGQLPGGQRAHFSLTQLALLGGGGCMEPCDSGAYSPPPPPPRLEGCQGVLEGVSDKLLKDRATSSCAW